jgi:hypothetical protein
MKKIALCLSAVVAFGTLVACGGGGKNVWRPTTSPGYVDMEGKKFLVMPAGISGIPGDELKMSAALFGGFVAEFGSDGISLQPIQPLLEKAGLGRLSYNLARGLTHAAFFHNSVEWDACSGEDYSKVPTMVMKLVEQVGKLLGQPDLKFDYIVVLNIRGSGSGMVPGTIKYRVDGGIYDPFKKEIAVAVQFEQTTSEDLMMAEMATLGAKAVGLMKGTKPE